MQRYWVFDLVFLLFQFSSFKIRTNLTTPSVIKGMSPIFMITFFHLVSSKRACTGKYFSTSRRNPSLKLTKEQHETIIGLALGDLYLSKGRHNVRLRFKQGAKNSLYLTRLRELFYDYFSSLPKFISLLDKRTNKIYYSVIANTLQLPIFPYYH